MNFSILYQNRMGGTDFLLKRLSSWLSKNGLTEIDISSNKAKNTIIDIIILPTSELQNLLKIQREGVQYKKIFIWSMGYGALTAAFYNSDFENIFFGIPKKIFDYFIGNLTLHLIKHHVIYFTDEPGLNYDLHGKKILPCIYKKHVIPIGIERFETTESYDRDPPSLIVVGWLGRISNDFKTLPLSKLISDMNKSEIINKIDKLIVIGSGDGVEKIQNQLKNYNKVPYELINNIKPDTLNHYLSQNIDLLFAMGTSALDGANSGVATVITKPYHHESETPQESYRWIYDSKGYSLGELDSNQIMPPQKNVNIQAIFHNLHNQLTSHEKKSKDYSNLFCSEIAFTKILEIILAQKEQSFSPIFLYLLTGLNSIKKIIKKLQSLRKND